MEVLVKPDEIWTELARRAVSPDDTPQRKAERWIEAERAVKAAGSRYAGPAWALVRDMRDGDMIAAFNEQVQAFRDLPSRDNASVGGAQPAQRVRQSSWRVRRPPGL